MQNDKIDIFHEKISDVLKLGANYADIYVQSGSGHSVSYENNRIEELSSSNSDGCGVRIVIGDKTYYSHMAGMATNNISTAFAKAVNSAFNKNTSADIMEPHELIDFPKKLSSPDIDVLHSINAKIRKTSQYIRQVALRYSVSKKHILIIKADGTIAVDNRDYCSFIAQVITERNGILQTGSERRCMAVPFEKFWNNSTPLYVANIALNRALLMMDAKACPAGKMKVLFAGEAGGTIVHEACGHGLEADIVDKDYSVYRDKIGQMVAKDTVTMIDDPTIPNLFGSYDFDDEGTAARRNILIKNGILKKYITDILSSKSLGLELTANGRRESYRNIPVPRMSNTFILPGKATFDSMLDQAKNGLYVKKMGGGEVNPTSGDFVFFVSEGYLIKNGKIAEPVRGATLTGNGPSVLKNILELGNNLVMDPGICGKSGQGVPVTDGQPSMLIDGLTVGGSEA